MSMDTHYCDNCGYLTDPQEDEECQSCVLVEEHIHVKKKLIKMTDLLVLTDPVVSDVVVGKTQLKQWNEFIRVFPNEGEKSDKESTDKAKEEK